MHEALLLRKRRQEVVAYHKVIEGRGCAAQLPSGKRLQLVPTDEDTSLYVGSTKPTYVVAAEKAAAAKAAEAAERARLEKRRAGGGAGGDPGSFCWEMGDQ